MWFFDKMKELDNSSGRTDKKKGGHGSNKLGMKKIFLHIQSVLKS